MTVKSENATLEYNRLVEKALHRFATDVDKHQFS